MLDVETIRRKSIKGVFSYAFRTGFLQLIGIAAYGILSAYLSPEEFGIYFIVTSMIGIFTFMSDIGLAATLVQKKLEPTLTELRTTFTVQQILAMLIFGLSVGLTPVWQAQTPLTQEGLWLLYALAFSFVMASFKTIPSILLERKLAFDKLVIPQVLESLVFYGLAVVLAIRGYGVTSYTVAVVARSLVGVVSIYFLQRWPLGFAFSKEAFLSLLRFGAKFQLNDFLARIKDDLIIVVLARFLSAGEMGLIGWAKRWSTFPYQLSVNSVVAITFPTYSRLQDDKVRLTKAVEKSVFFISLLIFPVLAGMMAMAYPLTEVIPQYQKWQPALLALAFFCINIAWSAVSTPMTNTLNAIGEISVTLKLMLFWTTLTWVLTPLGVILFGATGIAIASALVASTSVITIYLIKRYLPIRFIDQVWRQLAAASLMGSMLMLGQAYWSQSIGWFITGVLVGAGIYLAAILAMGYNKVSLEIVSLVRKRA
jgi:O-antigen/teichoic acid export membrane protein